MVYVSLQHFHWIYDHNLDILSIHSLLRTWQPPIIIIIIWLLPHFLLLKSFFGIPQIISSILGQALRFTNYIIDFQLFTYFLWCIFFFYFSLFLQFKLLLVDNSCFFWVKFLPFRLKNLFANFNMFFKSNLPELSPTPLWTFN